MSSKEGPPSRKPRFPIVPGAPSGEVPAVRVERANLIRAVGLGDVPSIGKKPPEVTEAVTVPSPRPGEKHDAPPPSSGPDSVARRMALARRLKPRISSRPAAVPSMSPGSPDASRTDDQRRAELTAVLRSSVRSGPQSSASASVPAGISADSNRPALRGGPRSLLSESVDSFCSSDMALIISELQRSGVRVGEAHVLDPKTLACMRRRSSLCTVSDVKRMVDEARTNKLPSEMWPEIHPVCSEMDGGIFCRSGDGSLHQVIIKSKS